MITLSIWRSRAIDTARRAAEASSKVGLQGKDYDASKYNGSFGIITYNCTNKEIISNSIIKFYSLLIILTFWAIWMALTKESIRIFLENYFLLVY
jgi:hypothetical protein